MKFKNKASKLGFYFGRLVGGLGVIVMITSLPFICNDFGDKIISIKGAVSALAGFLMYWYGEYRTGGDIS
jgi:hypothetical protein